MLILKALDTVCHKKVLKHTFKEKKLKVDNE